ncbi:MAG: cobyrinic acid a,c-diamide synthase [Silanimonas sp.]|nr:MAG: cobyrinic acid a,c-diamide synthase [Silanimonas sp.]
MPPEAAGPVRVLAVASGKGGVGKTNVSVNLATALAALGERVMLLDADFGLANVDVLLGLTPKLTLADVVAGRAALAEILLPGPRGIQIVPSASGKRHMAEMSPAEHAGIVQAVSAYEGPLDTLVVDTAAGINDAVLTFCQAAQEVLVVVCDEPASITDAYALVKVLCRERGLRRVHVVANLVRSPVEGRALYDKLARVVEKFLPEASLAYLGAIPQDEHLRRAVQRQKPVVEAFPTSPSAAAFRELATRVHRWARTSTPRGHVEFFLERMLEAGGARA